MVAALSPRFVDLAAFCSHPPVPKDQPTALPFLPPSRTLTSLRTAATDCRGCDLWERGTQTVFGEGNAHAELILIGEQPGDAEDLAGRPFVGPAGKLLDRMRRRRRDRPLIDLCHQRREALQMGATRQTPNPQQIKRPANQSLQALARSRD